MISPATFEASLDNAYAAPQDTDLNMDGVPDMVLQLGDGRVIPLYGVAYPDERMFYVSGSKMRERFPAAHVNYAGIEAELNNPMHH